MTTDSGRVPGSREPSPSSTGLGPSGFDPARGPFLIWSRKRSLWHRRDEDGEARGYTRNLFDAGVFDAKTALEYGDGVNNGAMTLEEVLRPLAAEIEDKRLALEEAEERYARFAAIAMKARKGRDGETRLDPKDDSACRKASPK